MRAQSVMVRKSKNEITGKCIHCNEEGKVAYWDDELEHYIYLCDIPPICEKCASTSNIQTFSCPEKLHLDSCSINLQETFNN